MTEAVFGVSAGAQPAARRRSTSTAAVVFVVAAGTALVLAMASGARRTASAPYRFTESLGGGVDVAIVQPAGSPLADAVDAVAALDEVEQIFSLTFVATSPEGAESDSFAGDFLFPGDRILEGRLPDPPAPREFVANRSFVDQQHLRVGDSRQFMSLNQGHVDRNAYSDKPGAVLRRCLPVEGCSKVRIGTRCRTVRRW